MATLAASPSSGTLSRSNSSISRNIESLKKQYAGSGLVRPRWPPVVAPRLLALDLSFFRRLFTSLQTLHGEDEGEIPKHVFKESIERLYIAIGREEDFDVTEFDKDSSGAVDWKEFVMCWRNSKVAIEFTFVERIYMTLEQPGSCLLGVLVCTLIMGLIFLSSICFVLSTLPSSRKHPDDCPDCEPVPLEIFFRVEFLSLVVFTAEYFIRMVVTVLSREEFLDFERILHLMIGDDDILLSRQSQWKILKPFKFLVQPMNIVDLMVILPFFMGMVLDEVGTNFAILRVLRLTRLLRLIKLGRYFEVLEVIVKVFQRSMRAFMVLLFYLSLGVVFSSALVYFVEGGTWDPEELRYMRVDSEGVKSETPFKSIPHAFWWSFVTFTTVGFGDIAPVTPLGKLVAAWTMMTGVLVLAMPISIVSLNFTQVWAQWLEESRQTAESQEHDLMTVNATLDSMDNRHRLVIELYDDKAHTEFLGQAAWCQLPLESETVVNIDELLNLEPTGGAPASGGTQIAGLLVAGYTWTPSEEKSSESQGSLEVRIMRAENLTECTRNKLGRRDVYALVTCWPRSSLQDNAQQYKTRVDLDTLDPVWEEVTTFAYYRPEVDGLQREASNESKAADAPDDLGNNDDLLGGHQRWCLFVRVVAAYGLTNTDTGLYGDVSDPFVAVRVGSTEYATPVITNNLNPKWTTGNEFQFIFDKDEDDLWIDIKDADQDGDRDDKLGECCVELKGVSPGKLHHKRLRLMKGSTKRLRLMKGSTNSPLKVKTGRGELEIDIFIESCREEACQSNQLETEEVKGIVMKNRRAIDEVSACFDDMKTLAEKFSAQFDDELTE